MGDHLEGKVFRSVLNAENGDVGEETEFHYHQKDKAVWAEYRGGDVLAGHLVATVLGDGRLDMHYQHIDSQQQVRIGKCLSTPRLMANGKLKFEESWQWLNGDESSGYSEIVEC